MSSFIAGLLSMIGLGAVAAGVINQWGLVGFHLPAWAVCGSLTALYLLGWLLRAQGGAASERPVLAWLARCHGALLLLLGLALFAAIPAMWWGGDQEAGLGGGQGRLDGLIGFAGFPAASLCQATPANKLSGPTD
ncbi:MAG: hypothetical protein K9K66_10175 [Desulfarculaceae bacterium]|nr:hypothetical protein [Desulfarculaceae bacterium]MCF8073774.1 hypothetical protein [Desulfarculaceae bacterium]MCF8102015.1 hypothetical protein [Desulfarculaceae bacterium]MCF8115985.1 hypothetical protein [Desulfarculaceae bacterium]